MFSRVYIGSANESGSTVSNSVDNLVARNEEASSDEADVTTRSRAGIGAIARGFGKDDRALIENVATEKLVQGFIVGGVPAVTAIMLGNQFSPRFKAIPQAPKVLLGWAAAISTSYVFAELAITELAQTEEHEAYQRSIEKHRVVTKWQQKLVENRYTMVASVWALSMIGSLLFSFRNPNLKTSQKLIHARLYAQASTLGALGLGALAHSLDPHKDDEKKLILS